MGRAARAGRAGDAPRPRAHLVTLVWVALGATAAPARGQAGAPEVALEVAAPLETRTATLTPTGTSSAAGADTSTATLDGEALDGPPLSPEELALIEALTAPPTPAVIVPRAARSAAVVAPLGLAERAAADGDPRRGSDERVAELVVGARGAGALEHTLDGLPLVSAEVGARANPLLALVAPDRFVDAPATATGRAWRHALPEALDGVALEVTPRARSLDRALGASIMGAGRWGPVAARVDATYLTRSAVDERAHASTSTGARRRLAVEAAQLGLAGLVELGRERTKLRVGASWDRLDRVVAAASRAALHARFTHDAPRAALSLSAGVQRFEQLGLLLDDALAARTAPDSDTWSASGRGHAELGALGPLTLDVAADADAVHAVSVRGAVDRVVARAGPRLRWGAAQLSVLGGVAYVRSHAVDPVALGGEVDAARPSFAAALTLPLSDAWSLGARYDAEPRAPTMVERALGWTRGVDARQDVAARLAYVSTRVDVATDGRCTLTSGATRVLDDARVADAACAIGGELAWRPLADAGARGPLELSARAWAWPAKGGVVDVFPDVSAVARARVEPGRAGVWAELRVQLVAWSSAQAASGGATGGATLAALGGLDLGLGFSAQLAVENTLDAAFAIPGALGAAALPTRGLDLRAALTWRSEDLGE